MGGKGRLSHALKSPAISTTRAESKPNRDSGIVTRSLESAIQAVKRIQAGTVNVNEIPGYRLELSPFGGVKDSGLGIKEDELWDRKIISPKRASDLLRVRKVKPKAIEPLIVKPPGKRALVSEDDGREGYDSAADGVFDDLA